MNEPEVAARRSARDDVESRTVERLLRRISTTASARAVFGEPVRQGDVTVIPVARVRWGGGGGSGDARRNPDDGDVERGSGSGGGGAATASPAGFIEITAQGARFVPVRDPGGMAPLILVSAIGGWLLLRGLRGLFH